MSRVQVSDLEVEAGTRVVFSNTYVTASAQHVVENMQEAHESTDSTSSNFDWSRTVHTIEDECAETLGVDAINNITNLSLEDNSSREETLLDSGENEVGGEEGQAPSIGPLAVDECFSVNTDGAVPTISELTQDHLDDVIQPEGESEVFEDARDKVSPCSDNSEVDEDWRNKDKHIFVLSEAGKPIYTLHGDEELIISLFGVMQALVSYVADSGDSIRSIRTSDTTIVFLNKPSLILVAVSRKGLSTQQLTVQLTYIYNQILSVLTLTQLTRIFEQRRNYDLRKMLSGSERLMNHLSSSMDTDPSFFLSSVRCLALVPAVRDVVSESIIRYCGKMKNVVFGVVVADNQLVTLVRMKKYFIHSADLHLLFNLINATESFKNSESWTPICLPKFDASGFLHAHVSYISDKVCLVLITIDRNAFFELSEARGKIKARIEKHNAMSAIITALETSPFNCTSIDLPELRYFLYKSKTSAQYTAPVPAACYHAQVEMKRLFSIFLSIQNRFQIATRPVKLCYRATAHEIVLAWCTQSFELYTVFSPTLTKLAVLTAVNKLLRWVKREEERLFILTAPTF